MEKTFSPLDVKQLNENIFTLLDDEWMLVTAGRKEHFNTMTASWGGFGILWNRPVAFVFIRPQRYTFEFTEKQDQFTLSFLKSEHKDVLSYCGSHSGRDVDKVKETGISPFTTPGGNISFLQSRLILECRKLFRNDFLPGHFTDGGIIEKYYPEKDFHRMYIGEIISAFERK